MWRSLWSRNGDPRGAERVRVPGRGTCLVHISDISLEEQDRTATGFGELDRVLGAGSSGEAWC